MSQVPYPHVGPATPVRSMRSNRRVDTRPELRLRSELHRRGLRFRKDYGVRPDSGRLLRPDIVFTRAYVAVFVDGCFWHRCPHHGNDPKANSDYWRVKLDRNVFRDRENDRRLSEAGWTVLRVWEHEEVIKAAERIEQAVDAGRSRRHHQGGDCKGQSPRR